MLRTKVKKDQIENHQERKKKPNQKQANQKPRKNRPKQKPNQNQKNGKTQNQNEKPKPKSHKDAGAKLEYAFEKDVKGNPKKRFLKWITDPGNWERSGANGCGKNGCMMLFSHNG